MNVPFYRKKFDEIEFNPDDLRSLDDLRKLPFTTKNDLRDNYPYGLFAVPLREVVRIHASSGTTGMSTVVGLFAERHQDLVEPRGADPGGRRHHQGRRHPDRLQLRPVHRRLRPPLRRGAARRLRHSHLERQYPAPDPDHAGLQDHGARGHAELRHADRRHHDGNGDQSELDCP